MGKKKKYASINYEAVALDNRRKLEHLEGLSRLLKVTGNHDVALLAEASTFGFGICPDYVRNGEGPSKTLCNRSPEFFFPPNVADIAYGIYKQEAQQASDLANGTRQIQNDHHVSLESGAENGSE